MNLVKVKSTIINESKRFVKFLRLGNKDVQECNESSPFGFDSNPVEGMVAIYSKTSVIGEPVIIGYINKNQIADVGESRMYSTNSDGDVQTYIHLKNDGNMEIGGDADFMVRFNKLNDGFKELRDDFNNFTSTTFATHVHPGVFPGVASTAVTPSVATPSTASIDDAKIDEIKTL